MYSEHCFQKQQYTHFFSSAHETFSRIGHMLGHKTNLHKFKNKIIQSIFFSHHSVKLEIDYKRKVENVELKQHVTEQQRGRRRNLKKNFFIMSETNENGSKMYQNLWDAAKAGLRSS